MKPAKDSSNYSKLQLDFKILYERSALSRIQALPMPLPPTNATLKRMIEARRNGLQVGKSELTRAKYKLSQQLNVQSQNVQNLLRKQMLELQQKQGGKESMSVSQFHVKDVHPASINEYTFKFLQYVLIDDVTHAGNVSDPFQEIYYKWHNDGQAPQSQKSEGWNDQVSRPFVGFRSGNINMSCNPSLYEKFMLGQEISHNWLWELLKYQMMNVQESAHKSQLILKNTVHYLQKKFSQTLPYNLHDIALQVKRSFPAAEPVIYRDRVPIWGVLFLLYRAGKESELLRTAEIFKVDPEISKFKSLFQKHMQLKASDSYQIRQFNKHLRDSIEKRAVEDIFMHQLYQSITNSPLIMSDMFVNTTGEQFWHYLKAAVIPNSLRDNFFGEFQRHSFRGESYDIDFQQLQSNVINLFKDKTGGIAEMIYVQAYREALLRIKREMGFEEYLHVKLLLVWSLGEQLQSQELSEDIKRYVVGFFNFHPELSIEYLKCIKDQSIIDTLQDLIISHSMVSQIFDIDRRILKEQQVRLFKEKVGAHCFIELAHNIANHYKQRQEYLSIRLFDLIGNKKEALHSVLLHQIKTLQGRQSQTGPELQRINLVKDRLIQSYYQAGLFDQSPTLQHLMGFLTECSSLFWAKKQQQVLQERGNYFPVKANNERLKLVRDWLSGQQKLNFFYLFVKHWVQMLQEAVKFQHRREPNQRLRNEFKEVRNYCKELQREGGSLQNFKAIKDLFYKSDV